MGITHNKILRISAASLLAGIGCLALSQSSYATVDGTFDDNHGTTWKYSIDDTADPVTLTIGFKTKTSADATNSVFTVPSLAEVKSKVSNSLVNDLDTYFIRELTTGADASSAVAPTISKVDMTNAAKVQMKSLAPLFKNTDVSDEVELVFGEDMVIGDADSAGLFEGMKVKLTNLNNVKYIGWKAFENANLSETSRAITINSSQTVGGYAFAGTNATSISIDTEKVGFAFCKNCMDLTSLTIGDNVNEIYGEAFQGATNLKQTLDTKNIVEIDKDAFHDSGLTGLTVQNSLEIIREAAFKGTNLGSLDLSGKNVDLGNESFANANISTLDLGDKMEKIRDAVFYNNNITTVTMPKSIKKLGVSTFMRNPLDTLTINFDIAAITQGSWDGQWYDPNSSSTSGVSARILFGCGNYWWSGENACDEKGAYDSALNLKHLIINPAYGADETVPVNHYINYGNDSGHQGLKDLRARVKNIIPAHFFADMDSLESIVIGDGMEMIDSDAFMRGYSNHLGDNSYHPGYNGQPKSIANGNVLTSITIPDSIIAIGDKAFQWFSNNPDFTIDGLSSNLEYIGNQAFFMNAGTIKDLESKKIKYIGPLAFYAGINVEKIYIGDSLEQVNYQAFGGNHGYMDLTIDTDLFANSDKMPAPFRMTFGLWVAGSYINTDYLINLPNGFDGSSANGNVKNYLHHYKNITFTSKAMTEPNQGNNFLEGVYCDKIDLSATPWKTLNSAQLQFVKANELLLPSNLETLGSNVLVNATIKKELVLPSTLTTIEPLALSADASGTLGSIKIKSLPQSITKIGFGAFMKQSKVKVDLDLPNLTELGGDAFLGTSVRDVVLNHGITKIGNGVFLNTPALRDVTIDMNLYDTTINTDYKDKLESEYYTTEQAINNSYGVFAWAFGYGVTPASANGVNRFRTIKLTSNAGQPCDGFGNCEATMNPDGSTPCKDNNNNNIDCDRKFAFFYGINASKIDLSEVNMTTVPVAMFQDSIVGEIVLPDTITTIGEDAFYQARIGKMELPDTIETIDEEAFQWAYGQISGIPAGVKNINRSAFYGADVMDDVVIPASVEKIGLSAFNAGNSDVHYDTVSIEGDLTATMTNNQLIHQIFWNSDISTLIVHSTTLPEIDGTGSKQEFWHMPMEEVVITALPAIPDNAFEANENLKMVVMRRDGALRSIGEEAFIDCAKLHVIKFSDDLANETVTLGKNAFNNTGFVTIGGDDAQFKLTAANFDASAGYVFTNMAQLTNVNIPDNFSNATVPEGTFANNPELVEVTVDPGVDRVKNVAFANDSKLERVIFWGDTIVEDSSLAGYTAPTRSAVSSLTGPTIPLDTNIYAYTGAKAEEYASHESRTGEGQFYPLDEVLYIATNRTRITESADEDFNTDEITVYALRRDGIIMESDTWGEYDGTAYPRSESNVHFTKEAATVEADPAFGTVFETPISVDNLDFSNENFTNISYTVEPAADDSGNRVATITYTDGYTGNEATTPVLMRLPLTRATAPAQQAQGGSGSSSEPDSGNTQSGSTGGSETQNSGTQGSSAQSGSTGTQSGTSGTQSSSTSGNTGSSNSGSSSTSGAGASQSGSSNAGTQNSSSNAGTQSGNTQTSGTQAGDNGSSESQANGSNESSAAGQASEGTSETVTTGGNGSETASSNAEAAKTTASASAKTSGTSNPKTGDTILGYVALLGSCTLLGGAAVAIIRHNKR